MPKNRRATHPSTNLGLSVE